MNHYSYDMKTTEPFKSNLVRITIDPRIFGGKPCIRGLRFPVCQLIDLVASGNTVAQIREDFPFIDEEDIRQALACAAYLAREDWIAV